MKPQLAHKVSDNSEGVRLCTNDSWWATPKLDGMRLIICVDGDRLLLYNRNGEPFTRRLKDDVADWFEPFEGDWAFDGELMDDGRYIMFDLFRAKGILTESTPYYKRFAALQAVYAKCFAGSDHIEMVKSAQVSEEKVALARHLADNGGEGVMFNHMQGQYNYGRRSHHLRKWKFIKSLDAIVGEVGREGKQSVQLFLIDKESGAMVDVGAIKMTPAQMNECERGDVVEVSYLYVNNLDSNPRLYQAVFSRFRPDKEAAACWTDQMQGTDKYAFDGINFDDK